MAGPVAFIACWAVLGATADGYDPTREAISRLAAVRAPTRPVMTAGLVALAGGMALYATGRRPRRTWMLAATNAAATLGIAAVPLGSGHDGAHGACAALGYLTLAAIPAVHRGTGLAVGAVSATCLVASSLGGRAGLFQRIGLTVALAWVMRDAVTRRAAPA